MNTKTNKYLIGLLLLIIFALASVIAFTPLIARADDGDETDPYPQPVEYDFTVAGSTISFLDKDGTLLTEKEGWTEGEAVVNNWYVFMYRTTKDNLKLGYSPEGKLFLPHKVYEGNTADLLYVKNNNLFRVNATKDTTQIFDGSKLLKTFTLKATNGSITLANAPVYAETPFQFVYMGTTDANGNFEVNATVGSYKLWIASNAGYILNKSITVADDTTEISFANEISNAVEIDITARSETYSKALGYVVAIGKPNETDDLNMLTTSYISPEKTVFVTAGTYSVSCAIWLKDYNNYYSNDMSGGLWIDVAKNATISQKTTYSFATTDFEGRYAIREEYKLDAYGLGDLMAYKVYAEHPNGYIIPGRADPMEYLTTSVIVTVGETQYPYTFGWSEFSMLYDANVYKKGNDSTILRTWESTDWEFSLSYDFFGETENEYVVKYFPKWDSMSFPDLFPVDVWYSTTFKTKPLGLNGVTYKTFESSEYFHEVYYVDANGFMEWASYDYVDERFFYSIPSTVKNGDYLLGVEWKYDRIRYGIIPVSDELFANGYTFVDHANYSEVNIAVKNGENDESDYFMTFDLTIEVGTRKFKLNGIESGMMIPYGEYVIGVNAYSEQYDDEYNQLGSTFVIHMEKLKLSAPSHTINVDFSTYKSFVVDASAFFPEGVWPMADDKKQIAFHFADGTVHYVDWSPVPTTIYCSTLPVYATGEMYYFAREEMTPFSPYVSIAPFKIEAGKTYKFDFKPTSIEVKEESFSCDKNTVLTYAIADGFGNVINDVAILLNEWGVHNPLRAKEYPFLGADGKPENHRYTVDVYYRLKGTTEYQKISVNNFSKVDLGLLPEGDYEGYIEINFDTYRDEYLVEYPMEKGMQYNEWYASTLSVYDNLARIFHGLLRDEFSFSVTKPAHQHDWSDWTDDMTTDTHSRVCQDPNCNEKESFAHNYGEGQITKTPKCGEAGEKTYTCEQCKKVKTEPIQARTHDWSEWTDDGENMNTDAHSRICKYTDCQKVEKENHGWSGWTKVDDNTHKKTCSVCNGVRTARHDWDNGNVTLKPTEDNEGTILYTCTTCKHTKEEKLDKLQHSLTYVPAQPATCTQDGNVEHYFCTGCQRSYSDREGTVLIENTTITKLGHDLGNWTDTGENSPADVHIRSCKRQNCTYSETENHSWSGWTKVDNDTHKKTCSVCNGVRTTRHTWSEWTIKDDTHSRNCDCGATESGKCDFSEEITRKPTHIDEGEKTFTCNVCGNVKRESIPTTTEHEWSDWEANDDDTHTRHCGCKAVETVDCEYEEEITLQPSHTTEGEKTFTCTICGGQKTEKIEKTPEHTFGDWAPLATVSGKHFRECKCGEIEEDNCVWNDGEITIKPTIDSTGTKTYTCTICNGIKTETIDQLEPAEEIVSPDGSGVKINVEEGSNARLDENTVIDIKEVKEEASETVQSNVQIVGGKNAEIIASYDISLLLDGAEVQPGGKVAVTLPMPANASGFDSIQVVFINDDGSVTPCETRLNQDGTITFVTDHFSHYAIIGVEAGSSAGLVVGIIAGAVVLAVGGFAIFWFVIKKKTFADLLGGSKN